MLVKLKVLTLWALKGKEKHVEEMQSDKVKAAAERVVFSVLNFLQMNTMELLQFFNNKLCHFSLLAVC